MLGKKIIGGLGTAVAVGLVVVIVGLSSSDLENSTPPIPTLYKNEKVGLVINTPTSSITIQELDEIYEKAASTGIGRSNVYMFWNVIEPERGNYNWDQTDALMSFNKQHDLKVTLYFSLINGRTLGPFPDWIGKPSLVSISEGILVEVLDAILTRYDIIDTVIISGDTDAHFRYSEQNIPLYQELFNQVYDSLKEKHNSVKMGTAFSLHGVLNKDLRHIVKELDAGDFVAFTYFPVDPLNEINKTPQEARADLEQIFELVPNKKVGFFEISWSTDDFVGGSQAGQAEFLATAFDFYNENESKFEFFTWYRLHDKPEGTCVIDPQTIEGEGTISVGGGSGLGSSEHVIERLSHYICNAGLIDIEGIPKQGWNEFTRQVQMNINS